MNNCEEVQMNWINGYYSSTDCHIVESSISSRSTTGYINLSKIYFDRTNNSSNGNLHLCKYDKNDNLLDITLLSGRNFQTGSTNTYDLDSNYKYKISYNSLVFTNIRGFNCNKAIASMSNELAFGSGSSLFTNLGDIAPLFIVVIGFALGFYFLKKIVRKGQKGRTL